MDRLAEQNAALAQANRDADQARRVAIEARQRLEESLADVQAAMAARGQFVNMVSHELRTPLGGILGMAELLSMTPLLPDQRRHLDVITRSGEALLRLINDLLDLSKLDSGRLSLELTKVNLREVVDAVVAAASQKANAKSLDLVADVAPDVPAQITSDPLRLRQVLSNLVDNAIKFTHRGHVAVRLTFDADNQRIRCIVEDTGIGIAPMHAARIFEPFMQADNSTTRRYGGTGLGLSISRSLAAHLGGALEFASDEGRGSRFWIDVPAVDAVPLRPPVSRGTAYLMAGEPIRTALEHALLGLGWEISAEKPDVTLVDIDKFSLPTEATRVIRMSRSGHPGSLRLPATLHELTEAVAVVSGPRLKVAAIGRDLVVSAILARCVVVLGHRAPTADETPDLVLVDEEGAAEAASRWPGVRVVEVGAPVDLAHVRDALGPVAMA